MAANGMDNWEDYRLFEGVMSLGRPLLDGSGFEMGDIKGMLTCPYYESHVVGCGKYAKHVNACRAAAPESVRNQFKVCPYNATHHIRAKLIEKHLQICASKSSSASAVAALTDEFYDDWEGNEKMKAALRGIKEETIDEKTGDSEEEVAGDEINAEAERQRKELLALEAKKHG